MPELPEVETIVRSLRDGGGFGLPVVGRTIVLAEVFWARTIAYPTADEFAEQLPGLVIERVWRRGKYIILHLSGADLLIHLRMSGDVRVETILDESGAARPLLPHDRVVLWFVDQTRLVFNNPRKFGRMWLVDNAENIVGQLGPEPLSDDLNGDILYALLRRHHRMIKPLLLDQTFIAGMGNIYTDEALFLAGIHPRRRSDTVSLPEAHHLMETIRIVLNHGIQANGASIDWVYRGGGFQNQFRVYQRTGEACSRCGGRIERTVVGQRGTHFCPHCQPLEGGQDD
jgi:formamidopyrimidine-DNA glycosylase